MKKNLPGKLTFSNVIACLALFVALGGSAYAATQLPKNSVGSKQLKKNAVTGAKIKNGAITGAKLKLSSLGAVPAADQANVAANANALGGQPPSAYASSSVVITGHAKYATAQTFLTGPGGWTIKTVSGGTQVTVSAPSGDRWSVGGPGVETAGTTGISQLYTLANFTTDFYVRDVTKGQEWSIVCLRDVDESEVACTAVGR